MSKNVIKKMSQYGMSKNLINKIRSIVCRKISLKKSHSIVCQKIEEKKKENLKKKSQQYGGTFCDKKNLVKKNVIVQYVEKFL